MKHNHSSTRPSNNPRNQQGVALVIVLAFVVLLTGLFVAFFSRAMAERQISNSSANLTKAALLAEGAADQIVSDLQQEIAAGSTAVGVPNGAAVATGTIYVPTTPLSMLPAIAGLTGTNIPPNLLKISSGSPFYSSSLVYSGTSVYSGTGIIRGSSISSTGTSLNGRSISLARWNASLLLPKASVNSVTDLTPLTSGSSVFVAPSWVLVARDGSNPQTWNNNMVTSSTNGSSVVGRYAYAIYHEGGLLDINAAGYPTVTSTAQQSFKPSLAYADLRQIPGIGVSDPITTSASLSTGQQNNLINNIVGWRNIASAAATGTMGSVQTAGYAITSGTPYFNAMISNTTGFLTVTGSLNVNNQSDRMFTSRQELIKFIVNGLGNGASTVNRAKLQNALQYLTHFSRDLNQPSLVRLQSTNSSKTLDYNGSAPKVLPASAGGNSAVGADDLVNPSFPGVRVGPGNAFTRNDGSAAVAGEPLVKKRFALNRLAWVTYAGASHDRTQSDPDIQALIQNGISWEFLQQGTLSNIQKYFGLNWDQTAQRWKYNVHNGPAGKGTAGAIMMLENIAALSSPHEPDFFELLKATMNVGSLGKALLASNSQMPASLEHPYNYNYLTESSVDVQILRIGANIITQFQPSNYPLQIVFDDSSNASQMPLTIVGISNLPYLNSIVTGVLQVQAPSGPNNENRLPRNGRSTGALGSSQPSDSAYQVGDSIGTSGIGAVVQLPVVWNPHDPTSSMGAAGSGPTKFRVVADSAAPDQAQTSGTHFKIFTFAGSSVSGSSSLTGSSQYSYAADASSPGASWYRDALGTGFSIAHTITADTSAIEFTLKTGTAPLFSEPTMLLNPGIVTDSCGNTVTVAAGASSALTQDPLGPFFKNGGLLASVSSSSIASASGPYLGINLGAVPLAWNYTSGTSNPPLSAGQSGAFVARYTGLPTTPSGSLTDCFFTYRMQYLDSSGNWVTYDTKYAQPFRDSTALKVGEDSLICGYGNVTSSANPVGQAGSGGFWSFAVDPRTNRFGFLWNGTYCFAGGGLNSPFNNQVGYLTYKPLPGYGSEVKRPGGFLNMSGGWVDKPNNVTLNVRPDAWGGWFAMAGWPFSGGNGVTTGKITSSDGTASGWMAWVATDGSSYPGLQPGVLAQNNTEAMMFYRRYYNDTGGGSGNTHTPEYFADPDGMVRRGMAAFVPPGSTFPADMAWPAATTIGLPTTRVFPYATDSATQTGGGLNQVPGQAPTIVDYLGNSAQILSQAQSRPYFLHRPFRSVGDLGYVFSDTPWRNLDLSTAESGGAALLDVFCLSDSGDSNGVVAGKVNLNTRQAPCLRAILAGSYIDPSQAGAGNEAGKIDPITADVVAKALVERTTDTTSPLGPLQNVSELVSKWTTAKTPIVNMGSAINGINRGTLPSSSFSDGKLSYIGFADGGWDSSAHKPKVTSPAKDIYSAYMSSSNSPMSSGTSSFTNIQRFREAPIRALASTGQTRIWNLMIDVVAQIGRYPTTVNNDLNKFIVEGEQRYWVHVAIDRYTGQVIDKQIEVVKE